MDRYLNEQATVFPHLPIDCVKLRNFIRFAFFFLFIIITRNGHNGWFPCQQRLQRNQDLGIVYNWSKLKKSGQISEFM